MSYRINETDQYYVIDIDTKEILKKFRVRGTAKQFIAEQKRYGYIGRLKIVDKDLL